MVLRVLDVLHLWRGERLSLKICIEQLGLTALPFLLSYGMEPNVPQLFKKEIPIFLSHFQCSIKVSAFWFVFSHFAVFKHN